MNPEQIEKLRVSLNNRMQYFYTNGSAAWVQKSFVDSFNWSYFIYSLTQNENLRRFLKGYVPEWKKATQDIVNTHYEKGNFKPGFNKEAARAEMEEAINEFISNLKFFIEEIEKINENN